MNPVQHQCIEEVEIRRSLLPRMVVSNQQSVSVREDSWGSDCSVTLIGYKKRGEVTNLASGVSAERLETAPTANGVTSSMSKSGGR